MTDSRAYMRLKLEASLSDTLLLRHASLRYAAHWSAASGCQTRSFLLSCDAREAPEALSASCTPLLVQYMTNRGYRREARREWSLGGITSRRDDDDDARYGGLS